MEKFSGLFFRSEKMAANKGFLGHWSVKEQRCVLVMTGFSWHGAFLVLKTMLLVIAKKQISEARE